jgi:hypothetical protein
MSAIRKALAWLTLGIMMGAAIWIFSPWLTGKIEPWDADQPIWTLSWLVVAILGGLIGHVRGVCLPLGYALGQMLVTIKSVFVGQFGALGWMFIGTYAAVAVAVTLALIGTIALLQYLWRMRSR